MRKMSRIVRHVAAAALLVGLAACGGPSESDVENAIRTVLDQQNAALGKLAKTELSNVEIGDIKSVGDDLYEADVSADVTTTMLGVKNTRHVDEVVRIREINDKWVAVNS
ncbi:hypothetical protein [Thalassospira marina]|uniref:Uncharacterized protein n=1 Tax=Thalassospira marina TaxID=2048283 RepID=A0A2N3L004_9PROT|nr:hypothetical protein [Thalassospira marina]AUG52197.1 hypothetical protein CSC3H3_05255 [Thalassospira marina]PKR56118.1 hypothetical protein COO20_02640 [Thalassospira marina]